MYDKTARLYDLVYEKGVGADYDAGAAAIAALVPDATSLLDVACGTGQHLARLRKHVDCAGVDLDPEMVAIARERCPDVPISVGDMVDFDLGRTFDAVVCMFSSIGYVRTAERLRAAVSTMTRHLASGGTLLVEPWFQREVLDERHVGALLVEGDGVRVARMSTMRIDGDLSHTEFHYLVGSDGTVEHHVETHTLGLFTLQQYRDAFERAGLETTFDQTAGPMGRGLFLGRKG